MKNIKLYALVGAVLLISLLALSGAWAGSNYPATVPSGGAGAGQSVADVDCPDVKPFGNNEFIACTQPSGATVENPIRVCFPVPNIFETTQIFFWNGSEWEAFATVETEDNPAVYVTGKMRCVDATSDALISFQGMQ
jgi:hypothetical protein